MKLVVAAGITLAISAPAGAEPQPQPDLRIHELPMPRTMKMRRTPRTSQAAGSIRAPIIPARPAPVPIATPPQALPITNNDLGLRDIQQPVSISLNVGYQVEATQLTNKPTINNVDTAGIEPSFTRLRSYGFGEGFLSTRGVGVANLSTYFALRFQASRDIEQVFDPITSTVGDRPSPIATWFERSGGELRTGWAEMKDFLPDRYGVNGLRVRAGDQFIYGPWIMHMDGGLAAWETKLIRFQAYAGWRHSDYTRDRTSDRATIVGGSARIDLRDLTNPLPIALAAEALNVGPDISSDARGSNNLQLEADWRPKQDFALIGKIRRLDGQTANERLEFRGRYKQVSNLVFDLVHRERADWQWDPALGFRDENDDTTTARKYLDIGPVLPQLVASLRGGTLVAENLDISVRGAFAKNMAGEDPKQTSFNASYVEGAAAVQMRLRRTVAVDASVLSRQNALPNPDAQIVDDAGPQALPDPTKIGEKGFTEVGAALRMTLGARRFSAAVELYGRKTRYASLYQNMNPDYASDIRGGGRFSIDAWVGERVRLYAAYDLSSRFEFAPEITGYKSLRLILAGTY